MPCTAIGLPVTALDVTENFIVAGEGPYLHLYDLSAGQSSRFSCKVLHHQVIHGIRKGHGCIYVVFGQKAINFIRIDRRNKSICVLNNVHEVTDWIWDVCWLQPNATADDPKDPASNDRSPQDGHLGEKKGPPSDSSLCNTSVAVATGHNAVLLWDVAKRCIVTTVHCQENCILYCAKFIGQTWSDLVLAAGTVFNQVVFWRPQGSRDASGRVVVDHRFKGHQGVIFNITYNAELGLLATVSDDRSIRLWRYHHPFREFGERPTEAERVLYGHSARVWCAEILSDKIVSVGEDATCCIWNMDGEIVQKLKSHKGKSIWSLAVQRDGSFVVTGGGDSSIRRWSIQNKKHHASADTATSTWDVQRDVKTLIEGQEGVKNVVDADVVPRTLTITSNGQLLVMTQGGYLFSWSNISSSYHLVMHDDNYQSYSVMASAPSSPLVAIGNIHGSLKVVLLDDHSTSESEIKAYDGNVFNVTWATNEDLFSTGMEGELTWWKVRKSPSLAFLAHAHFTLPPCKQRWATSVTLYGEDQFVCGDRRGSVHLFQRSHIQNDRPGPKNSVPGIHGKAGTSFVCHHDGSVYSAGRDGTYRQYYITDRGEMRLENTHKVYKGFEWLEKLVFTEDGDLHVMGFHSVNFVVWSTLNNEALLTVPCGGGHRSWDLSPLDDGSMTFVCIKMKQLLVQSVSSVAWQRQTILKDDIHGREITCIKFLRTIQITGQDHHVCVTGSEDTKVNIVSFSSPQSSVDPSLSSALLGDINVLHRLHAHVSSVRALAVCHSNSSTDEMLLFSVGGRYSINCWKVKFCPEASGISSLKQICTVRHLVSHSSLITTRSRQKLRQREKLLDPETRFLGVSVWRKGDVEGVSPTDGGHVMMCVASSDAFLRFFCFDEDTCKITPLGSSNMHDCCLLCVTSVRLTCDPEVKARVKPRTVVLTGGTDGHILVWDVQEAETRADKLAIDASICDDEEEEEDEVEEEEQIVGAAARNQGNIENEFNKMAKTRRGVEIDEQKKAAMRERRVVKNEAVIPLRSHGNHKPGNTAGNETMPSSISSSGAYQSAIETDVAQLDKHQISITQRREGGAGGGGIEGKPSHQPSHQGTSSSDSSNAKRTSGCHRTQRHSSPTAIGRPYDGEENIQSVSMVTQAESPTVEAAASTIQSSTSDVQSIHTRHTEHFLDLKERSVQSKQTTSGHVTSYPVGGHDTWSVGQMVSSWSAHQSGINALALHHVKDGKWIVVSGGDDNALTVTLMNLGSFICDGDEAMTGAVLDTYKIPTAHATQITGIQFIQPEHTFLSVSVDQRLNRWRLKLSVDHLKIQEVRMVSSSFVHVSDVAGLDTWNDRSTSQQYAVICGQGLQLMDISSDEEGVVR